MVTEKICTVNADICADTVPLKTCLSRDTCNVDLCECIYCQRVINIRRHNNNQLQGDPYQCMIFGRLHELEATNSRLAAENAQLRQNNARLAADYAALRGPQVQCVICVRLRGARAHVSCVGLTSRPASRTKLTEGHFYASAGAVTFDHFFLRHCL